MVSQQAARAAVVLKDSYPVRWAARQAVSFRSALTRRTQVSQELLSVINRGANPLIADMTATISRDYSGAMP